MSNYSLQDTANLLLTTQPLVNALREKVGTSDQVELLLGEEHFKAMLTIIAGVLYGHTKSEIRQILQITQMLESDFKLLCRCLQQQMMNSDGDNGRLRPAIEQLRGITHLVEEISLRSPNEPLKKSEINQLATYGKVLSQFAIDDKVLIFLSLGLLKDDVIILKAIGVNWFDNIRSDKRMMIIEDNLETKPAYLLTS